ncbi:hypothetical protein J6590_018709 [Homalodisca vitripennis]|nr:hypothetical protein J6590_018709 [Homalodisca vitripennis]
MNDEHDSRFQDSSLRQSQIPDAAIKGSWDYRTGRVGSGRFNKGVPVNLYLGCNDNDIERPDHPRLHNHAHYRHCLSRSQLLLLLTRSADWSHSLSPRPQSKLTQFHVSAALNLPMNTALIHIGLHK